MKLKQLFISFFCSIFISCLCSCYGDIAYDYYKIMGDISAKKVISEVL